MLNELCPSLSSHISVCRHTNEMIKKLETAGLGYHVGAVDTYEKIGKFLELYRCYLSRVFHFYLNILLYFK